MKVNEIFYSLQGEGAFSGTPAVFIRLSDCNLKCPFCDTEHLSYKDMSYLDVLREVSKYGCKHVVITGGEPAIQLTRDFIDMLKGYTIQVETNGTRELPEGIDWITCSPKDAFVDNGKLRLHDCNEVKVVFQDQEDLERYLVALRAKYYYLQPCDYGDEEKNKENLQACVEYIKAHPMWRLSLQTQKILNIR